MGLSPLEIEVLVSLRRHRLLTSRQVHVLHAPDVTDRWVRKSLAALAVRGLLDRVWTKGTNPACVWFLTADGLDATGPPDGGGPGVLVSQRGAAGALQAHTLTVNEVGIAFVRAARALDHECGYLAWRHEVAHRFADPRPNVRDTGVLVADALLEYVVRERGRELFVSRFIELDRGTVPPQQLHAKLRNYLRLHQYVPRNPNGRPGAEQWREVYPSFPPVLVVFTGKPRPRLESRLASVLALCGGDRRLRDPDRPGMFFVLLEDLQDEGPFAPVFVELGDPSDPVDVLGRPVEEPGEPDAAGGAEAATWQ